MGSRMRRRTFLAVPLALAVASACTPLLKLGAGPPHARARQAKLVLDAAGQPTGIIGQRTYDGRVRADRIQVRRVTPVQLLP